MESKGNSESLNITKSEMSKSNYAFIYLLFSINEFENESNN